MIYSLGTKNAVLCDDRHTNSALPSVIIRPVGLQKSHRGLQNLN